MSRIIRGAVKWSQAQDGTRRRCRSRLVAGALGGIRTPSLLIRRHGQVVQDRPPVAMTSAPIPCTSPGVGQGELGGGHQVRGVGVRHRCQAAQQSRRSPRSGRGGRRCDRATPVRPRAVRSGRTPAIRPSSAEVTCRPRISRCPSAFTPVASRAWTFTTRPPSRTFSTRASAATNVYAGVQRPDRNASPARQGRGPSR